VATLESLLRQAAASGGWEVQLITGRKIVVVTANGEREIAGPEVGPQMIQQLVAPTMPPDARQAIARGRAEWTINDAELGSVHAMADLSGGSPRVIFTLPQRTAAPAPIPLASMSSAAPAPVAAPAPAPTPIPRAPGSGKPIDEMFRQMFALKASDLHISTGNPPMLRLDGEIQPLPGYTTPLSALEVEQLLMPIAPEKNRHEFHERHDTDFAYELPGTSRFRCNFFMDRKGMGGVFRVIPSKIMTAEDMGLSKEILDLCFLSKGLVLVTGPTGSGKSTTLCALIDYVNRYRTDHVITIEDPIEFVHDNKKCLVNQRQVGEHTNSFKDALRAALREDPDIVLVGELRDLETIAIAIETAETGHLVFGTLHTSSAASTVDRIVDQFPSDRQEQIRVMLASSLKGVISQMLCKKIGGGRVPALEVMIGTAPIANMIREAKVFQIPSIMQTSKKQGMCLMNDSFLDLVKRKVIEPQEAYAKAVDKMGLLTSMKAANIDVSFASAAPAIP
jgi:twitching motility protein PilT